MTTKTRRANGKAPRRPNQRSATHNSQIGPKAVRKVATNAETLCLVPGCGHPPRSRGLCEGCYQKACERAIAKPAKGNGGNGSNKSRAKR